MCTDDSANSPGLFSLKHVDFNPSRRLPPQGEDSAHDAPHKVVPPQLQVGL